MTPKQIIEQCTRRPKRIKTPCNDEPPYTREQLLQTGIQWPVNLLAKRVAGLQKINANRKDKP